jgi:phosphoribosylformimino-5-aminoimidazole carboxamide ribotide isomerase
VILFPAIDLHQGQCVRLTQGLLEKAKVYSLSPLDVARDFACQGASWIHLVDLDGAMDRHSSNRQVIVEMLKSLEIPVQVGGGIRTTEDAEFLIRSGAARVIVGSMAVEQPEGVQSLVRRWDGRVCVGVDVRDGQLATRGWTKHVGIDLHSFIREVCLWGVQHIIYTDISRDGTLSGPAMESTLQLARTASFRIIASGGISRLEDLAAYRDAGQGLIEGVIVGKALYEKRFTVAQALRVLEGASPQEVTDKS